MCRFIGPSNHSVLACIGDMDVKPDPACQLGLFHSSSKACCPSYCHVCETTRTSEDDVCSVEYVLRLAPLCSVAGPPCVVGHSFEMLVHEIHEAVGTTDAPSTLMPDVSQAATFPPWFTELVLPLATGFIACSCSLALCCYCLREARSYTRATRTPTSPPSNARVVGKVRARPKRRRRRASRASIRDHRPEEENIEEPPEDFPTQVEPEYLDTSNEMKEDRTEPYPLVDLWASPNAGDAEKEDLQGGGSQGVSQARLGEQDQGLSDFGPEIAKQSMASPGRSAWHSKWKDMEADLEAALTVGPDAPDIPQIPRSAGNRPKTKRVDKIETQEGTSEGILLTDIISNDMFNVPIPL